MKNTLISIENLYDNYSPLLYGIALEISQKQSEAEEILIGTFQKIGTQVFVKDDPKLCVTLIKLVIQTAHEQLSAGHFVNAFKLKQFESTPIFHKLICEQLSLDDYCKENKIKRVKVIKMIREEFISVRKLMMAEKLSFIYNDG